MKLYRCTQCQLVRTSRSGLNEAGCPAERAETFVAEAEVIEALEKLDAGEPLAALEQLRELVVDPVARARARTN